MQLSVLSAREVAGAKRPGKAGGEVRWHGSQTCCPAALLADRELLARRHKFTVEIFGAHRDTGFVEALKSMSFHLLLGGT